MKRPWAKSFLEKGQTPWTPAVSTVYALDAQEIVTAPLPGSQESVCLRDIARHGEHESDGMLRSRDGIPCGGIDHHDTLPRCCLQIDIVHAHTGTPDDLKPLSRLDDLR